MVAWAERGHGFLRIPVDQMGEALDMFEESLGEKTSRVCPQSPKELVEFARDYAARRGADGKEVTWLDSSRQPDTDSPEWNKAWLTAYNSLNGLDNQCMPSRFLVLAVPPGVLGPALNTVAPDFFSKRTF